MTVTYDTLIGDLLDLEIDLSPIFMEAGMHCLGCLAAAGETVEQACIVHGLDPDDLIDRLNEELSANK